MLQNHLHLQKVVQSSVPILSMLAFSVQEPAKHTNCVCAKIKINKLQTPYAMVTQMENIGQFCGLWICMIIYTNVG